MLRIATYNVHRAIGTDRIQDSVRLGNMLATMNADIIALQEVESAHSDTHPAQHLEQWAERLDMQFVAGPSMFSETAAYGNGIITSLAVEQAKLHNISYRRFEPRGVIDLTLRYNQRWIRVLGTHFGLKKGERKTQMQQLLEILRTGPGTSLPTILAGDFNEWRFFSCLFDDLKKTLPRSIKGRTFPARVPILALDHIWYSSEWSVMNKKVFKTRLARRASDHLPLCVTFELANGGN
jgi:endonuclease/exonuclease/phosphatase family metal-dependent hydrolase